MTSFLTRREDGVDYWSLLNKNFLLGVALLEDLLHGYLWVILGLPESKVHFLGWTFWTCLVMILLLLGEKRTDEHVEEVGRGHHQTQ
jgi:uncharacterized membrane-anchored protein